MSTKIRAKDIDMLQGKPTGQILRFSLPLIAGNLFAQFYAATDAAIVGNFAGVNAFAAINCTNWILWVLIALCRDASNAVCIMAAYQIGAQKREQFKRVIAIAAYMGALLSVLVCVALLISIDGVLGFMQVPESIYAQARQYLFIYTLSLPLMMIYNMACAILRATGNSRAPLFAMLVSTVVNIALDLLFVVGLGAGVAGAAWATLIAQGVAMVMVIFSLMGGEQYHIQKEHWRFEPALLKRFFSLFLPMFWNSAIITAGGAYVQSCINALGAVFTAGIAAGLRVFNIIEAIIMGIQSGVSVYIGQNLGGSRISRIRSGFRQITIVAALLTAVLVVFVWLFGDLVMALFLSKDDAAYQTALDIAGEYLRLLSLGMLIMTPMYFFRAAIQTLGHANYAMLAGVFQLAVRLLTVTVLPQYWGHIAYYLTDVFAWTVSLPIVAIPYFYYLRRLEEPGAQATGDPAEGL